VRDHDDLLRTPVVDEVEGVGHAATIPAHPVRTKTQQTDTSARPGQAALSLEFPSASDGSGMDRPQHLRTLQVVCRTGSFAVEHPGAEVSLVEDEPDDLVGRLVDGRLDVALLYRVRALPTPMAGGSRHPAPGLPQHGAHRTVLVAHRGSPNPLLDGFLTVLRRAAPATTAALPRP
jgi:hypothetical protein